MDPDANGVCCELVHRQLEVLRNNEDGAERGSLLWLMDHTKSPFGGRLLRNWVAHPLTDRQRINERLDAVEEMVAAGSAVEQGGKALFCPHACFLGCNIVPNKLCGCDGELLWCNALQLVFVDVV